MKQNSLLRNKVYRRRRCFYLRMKRRVAAVFFGLFLFVVQGHIGATKDYGRGFCDATLNIGSDGIVTVVVFATVSWKDFDKSSINPQESPRYLEDSLESRSTGQCDQDLAIHPFRSSTSARGCLFPPLILTTIAPYLIARDV